MFKWFKEFKEGKSIKDFFVRQNVKLADEIYVKLLELNEKNKYKARMILEYITKAFESDSSIEELYCKIYLGNSKTGRVEELLNYKSPINNKMYIHYKGNMYTTINASIPMVKVDYYDDYSDFFHTEDETTIRVYRYNNLYFHDYSDEVLVIYTNGNDYYARPYELFYSTVENNGLVIPRFKRIE